MNNNKIYFEKVKENAIIPSKNKENGGYDIYACFEEEQIIIKPGEIKLIPTGIATAFNNKYVAFVRERGSTGSCGMSIRAGVIDSGYRGEWFIPINNTTHKAIIIGKSFDKDDKYYNLKTFHFAEKAIAQFILTRAYHLETEVVDDINQFDSIRGEGKLGSTKK
ncbi:MAG: dUTP diphosphatase [Halanaerobiales bacterium]